MKKSIQLLVGLLLINSPVAFAADQDRPAEKVLECFSASNPQDAVLQQLSDADRSVIKQEVANSLNITIKSYPEYDQIVHGLDATSASFAFHTAGVLSRNRVGIDCDGGSWKVERTREGNMLIKNLSATGEIKDITAEEGCAGPGYIKAKAPLKLLKVTCQQ